MNSVRNIIVWWRGALALVCGLILIAGCATTSDPGSEGGSARAESTTSTNKLGNPDIIEVGERLEIEFLDITPTQKIDQTVQQDGTISLILGQSISVAGKTAPQVQKEIRDLYVNKNLFYRLSVNIKREVRFVSVGGEVKKPGPQAYMGNMSVVTAIQAAGDFTIYANKKEVQLIRSNGKMEIINVKEAIKDARKDAVVYPGDRIYVPLRII
jgi:protein involved in polysaccharide export with SLBB domain